ncbi:hypothetical protein F0130_24835 [Salmonella enterica]|nr:hypothetical protein [Salmonella enterica]
MRKYISLLSVSFILLTLSACHQQPVKSAVTPQAITDKQTIPSFELLPISESAHSGWAEVELTGRKWYIDADATLTRNELGSLSFVKNTKGELFLNIIPNQHGQAKINNALMNKSNYILMVLNGRALSLSKINSSQTIPFYVGSEEVTIRTAEDITQKKIIRK